MNMNIINIRNAMSFHWVFSYSVYPFQAITKDMFEEALRALADEDYLTVTGKTVRLLAWDHTLLFVIVQLLISYLSLYQPQPLSRNSQPVYLL